LSNRDNLEEFNMASLMIRSMDERVKAELRVVAARRGVSMEQHVRDILEQAVLGPAHGEPFADRVRRRFSAVAVDALPLPQRQAPRLPPKWGGR
jgi:plasmid stability protein